MSEDIRKLVHYVVIDKVRPIEGADAIEVAHVGGWQVVVKKGEFKEGSNAFYFEIDSALPTSDPRFAFLSARGVKRLENGTEVHVLKSIKLRGVVSQGLLLPFEPLSYSDMVKVATANEYDNEANPEDGRTWFDFDFASVFNVTKWEPPMPAELRGFASGRFPTHLISKTDSERVQNLAPHWDEIQKHAWYATEKIDGTSFTALRHEDGRLIVCGRNWQINDGANTYWDMVRKYRIDDLLTEPGMYIQGEIFGQGIQGNPLGLNDTRMLVFIAGNYIDGYNIQPEEIGLDSVPWYVLTFPATIEEAIAQADGIKSALVPNKLAEGIVWHCVKGPVGGFNFLGGRTNFKAISNKYILKHDG